jgi:adenine deaminase
LLFNSKIVKNLALAGNIVDVLHRRIFPGTVYIQDGHIQTIVRGGNTQNISFPVVLMLMFILKARFATVHGMVATVSDPHEIANVLEQVWNS